MKNMMNQPIASTRPTKIHGGVYSSTNKRNPTFLGVRDYSD